MNGYRSEDEELDVFEPDENTSANSRPYEGDAVQEDFTDDAE